MSFSSWKCYSSLLYIADQVFVTLRHRKQIYAAPHLVFISDYLPLSGKLLHCILAFININTVTLSIINYHKSNKNRRGEMILL